MERVYRFTPDEVCEILLQHVCKDKEEAHVRARSELSKWDLSITLYVKDKERVT